MRHMDDAPRNGTPIWGLVNGEMVLVRWARERRCMGAGPGHANGYFGPGWEDVENHLISDDPEGWLPAGKCPDRLKSEAEIAELHAQF